MAVGKSAWIKACMINRTMTAVLDHNSSANLPQATTSDGTPKLTKNIMTIEKPDKDEAIKYM